MDGMPTGVTAPDVEYFLRRHPRGTSTFMAAALRGVIPGVRRVVFTGANTSVDIASVPEEVWGGSGLVPIPAADESWEIVSSSAADAAAGIGARTISITTLGGDYAELNQTISLNGTTPVALAGVHRFINSANLLTAGSSGVVDGTITIRVAGAGATRGFISVDGLLNQCKYTVPAGYTLSLHNALVGVRTQGGGGQESVVFGFMVVNNAGRRLTPVRLPISISGSNLYRHEVLGGLSPFNIVAQRVQFSIGVVSVSQNSTQVDASVLGLLFQNSIWP